MPKMEGFIELHFQWHGCNCCLKQIYNVLITVAIAKTVVISNYLESAVLYMCKTLHYKAHACLFLLQIHLILLPFFSKLCMPRRAVQLFGYFCFFQFSDGRGDWETERWIEEPRTHAASGQAHGARRGYWHTAATPEHHQGELFLSISPLAFSYFDLGKVSIESFLGLVMRDPWVV